MEGGVRTDTSICSIWGGAWELGQPNGDCSSKEKAILILEPQVMGGAQGGIQGILRNQPTHPQEWGWVDRPISVEGVGQRRRAGGDSQRPERKNHWSYMYEVL